MKSWKPGERVINLGDWYNLVMHLDDLGITDGQMHRLYKLVEGYSA